MEDIHGVQVDWLYHSNKGTRKTLSEAIEHCEDDGAIGDRYTDLSLQTDSIV